MTKNDELEFKDEPFQYVHEYRLSLKKKLESLKHHKTIIQEKLRAHKDAVDARFVPGSVLTPQEKHLWERVETINKQLKEIEEELSTYDHRNVSK